MALDIATKERLSEMMKGLWTTGKIVPKKPWNKGLKGKQSWHNISGLRPHFKKGYTVSEEVREKMSKAKKGKKLSKEHKEKISLSEKGRRPVEALAKLKEPKIKEKRIKALPRGENHWNWKGGVTPLFKKLRNSLEWRNWRKAIFERDNYTCQECGKKNCYLHPHHKKSFIKYPKLRFDVNNGITLCKDCHYLLHTKLKCS